MGQMGVWVNVVVLLAAVALGPPAARAANVLLSADHVASSKNLYAVEDCFCHSRRQNEYKVGDTFDMILTRLAILEDLILPVRDTELWVGPTSRFQSLQQAFDYIGDRIPTRNITIRLDCLTTTLTTMTMVGVQKLRMSTNQNLRIVGHWSDARLCQINFDLTNAKKESVGGVKNEFDLPSGIHITGGAKVEFFGVHLKLVNSPSDGSYSVGLQVTDRSLVTTGKQFSVKSALIISDFDVGLSVRRVSTFEGGEGGMLECRQVSLCVRADTVSMVDVTGAFMQAKNPAPANTLCIGIQSERFSHIRADNAVVNQFQVAINADSSGAIDCNNCVLRVLPLVAWTAEIQGGVVTSAHSQAVVNNATIEVGYVPGITTYGIHATSSHVFASAAFITGYVTSEGPVVGVLADFGATVLVYYMSVTAKSVCASVNALSIVQGYGFSCKSNDQKSNAIAAIGGSYVSLKTSLINGQYNSGVYSEASIVNVQGSVVKTSVGGDVTTGCLHATLKGLIYGDSTICTPSLQTLFGLRATYGGFIQADSASVGAGVKRSCVEAYAGGAISASAVQCTTPTFACLDARMRGNIFGDSVQCITATIGMYAESSSFIDAAGCGIQARTKHCAYASGGSAINMTKGTCSGNTPSWNAVVSESNAVVDMRWASISGTHSYCAHAMNSGLAVLTRARCMDMTVGGVLAELGSRAIADWSTMTQTNGALSINFYTADTGSVVVASRSTAVPLTLPGICFQSSRFSMLHSDQAVCSGFHRHYFRATSASYVYGAMPKKIGMFQYNTSLADAQIGSTIDCIDCFGFGTPTSTACFSANASTISAPRGRCQSATRGIYAVAGSTVHNTFGFYSGTTGTTACVDTVGSYVGFTRGYCSGSWQGACIKSSEGGQATADAATCVSYSTCLVADAANIDGADILCDSIQSTVYSASYGASLTMRNTGPTPASADVCIMSDSGSVVYSALMECQGEGEMVNSLNNSVVILSGGQIWGGSPAVNIVGGSYAYLTGIAVSYATVCASVQHGSTFYFVTGSCSSPKTLTKFDMMALPTIGLYYLKMYRFAASIQMSGATAYVYNSTISGASSAPSVQALHGSRAYLENTNTNGFIDAQASAYVAHIASTISPISRNCYQARFHSQVYSTSTCVTQNSAFYLYSGSYGYWAPVIAQAAGSIVDSYYGSRAFLALNYGFTQTSYRSAMMALSGSYIYSYAWGAPISFRYRCLDSQLGSFIDFDGTGCTCVDTECSSGLYAYAQSGIQLSSGAIMTTNGLGLETVNSYAEVTGVTFNVLATCIYAQGGRIEATAVVCNSVNSVVDYRQSGVDVTFGAFVSARGASFTGPFYYGLFARYGSQIMMMYDWFSYNYDKYSYYYYYYQTVTFTGAYSCATASYGGQIYANSLTCVSTNYMGQCLNAYSNSYIYSQSTTCGKGSYCVYAYDNSHIYASWVNCSDTSYLGYAYGSSFLYVWGTYSAPTQFVYQIFQAGQNSIIYGGFYNYGPAVNIQGSVVSLYENSYLYTYHNYVQSPSSYSYQCITLNGQSRAQIYGSVTCQSNYYYYYYSWNFYTGVYISEASTLMLMGQLTIANAYQYYSQIYVSQGSYVFVQSFTSSQLYRNIIVQTGGVLSLAGINFGYRQVTGYFVHDRYSWPALFSGSNTRSRSTTIYFGYWSATPRCHTSLYAIDLLGGDYLRVNCWCGSSDIYAASPTGVITMQTWANTNFNMLGVAYTYYTA